jgi:hypothetical protein
MLILLEDGGLDAMLDTLMSIPIHAVREDSVNGKRGHSQTFRKPWARIRPVKPEPIIAILGL